MKVPVSKPLFSELAKENILDALNDKAISGLFGKYIPEFEESFAEFCGSKYAISCSSGTAAIHLPLAAYGLKKGDEVLVSSLTNMATFFAVMYTGATPIPVDIDLDTLNINIDDLNKKINGKTKAILVVHLFGHPVDMNSIMKVADDRNIPVFEDCAESHGAEYLGQKVGSFGTAGSFSFFANKILTSGEGGIVTTNDSQLNDKIRNIKSLAFGDEDKFQHKDIGFNYRFTNLQAALACEQVKNADFLINKRIEIANFYNEEFKNYSNVINLPQQKNYAKNVYWMYHMVLNPNERLFNSRQEICDRLSEKGIETRSGFIPFNLQQIFIKKGMSRPEYCPIASLTAYASFYIPTGPDISSEELDYVSTNFKMILDSLL